MPFKLFPGSINSLSVNKFNTKRNHFLKDYWKWASIWSLANKNEHIFSFLSQFSGMHQATQRGGFCCSKVVGCGGGEWDSTELIRDTGMNCKLCSLFSKARLASATLETFIPCLWESGGRMLHSQLHSAHADFN